LESKPITPIRPSHIFLADVHLGRETDSPHECQDSLIALIHWAKRHSVSLFILGDLFDYWMEFKSKSKTRLTESSIAYVSDVVPKFCIPVLKAIEESNASEKPTKYVLGNHDYWDNGLFHQIGCDCTKEGFIIELDGKKIALLHGDGLPSTRTKIDKTTLRNLERPVFHTMLRSKTFVRVFQYVFKPVTAWKIMRWFSNNSRKKTDQPVEVMDSKITHFIQTTDIDIVVAGHDHQARTVHTEHGVYYNTGPFFDNMKLLVYSDGRFIHAKWNADKNEFMTTAPKSYSV